MSDQRSRGYDQVLNPTRNCYGFDGSFFFSSALVIFSLMRHLRKLWLWYSVW